MAGTERAVFKTYIRGSAESVWREITKTGEPQEALFNMTLHAEGLYPGSPIQLRTASGKHTGAVGEVLEFDPPRRYAHTFRFTSYDDPPCRVTFDLVEVPEGVEFRLLLQGLPTGTRTAREMKRGGTMLLRTLKAVVETGGVPPGTRILYWMFRILEPLSPRRTRTAYWPLAGTPPGEAPRDPRREG